jgi:hypothetical protein
VVDFARNNAVPLELAQLLSEHLLRGVGQKSTELAEAKGAIVNQMINDDRLPFSSEHVERRSDRATFEIQGFHFDTMAQNSA